MATTVVSNNFTSTYAPWSAQPGVTLALNAGQLQITPTDAYTGAIWYSNTDFRCGEKVVFSGKARSSNGWDVIAHVWDADGSPWYDLIQTTAITAASLTNFSLTFTVPTRNGKKVGDFYGLQFGLLFGGGAASAYFDDLLITTESGSVVPVFMYHYNMLNQGS